jgi:hypothetical protein
VVEECCSSMGVEENVWVVVEREQEVVVVESKLVVGVI